MKAALMAVQTESSAGLLGMQSAAMSVSQRGRRKADKKAVQRDRLRVGLMAHRTACRSGLKTVDQMVRQRVVQKVRQKESQRACRKADKKVVQRDRLRVGLMDHQTVALWVALRGGLTAARKADRKALVTA